MNRSESAPVLQSAGASMAHSHIPKRATQHGTFLPQWETQLIDLKVGQNSVTRNVYALEAKQLSETYLHQDRPMKSVYNNMQQAKPDDYKDPVRPVKPSEPSEYCGHRGTSHWGSESKHAHSMAAIEGAQYNRQDGPSYQAANPPTCVSRGEQLSCFQEFHGKHGFAGPLSTVQRPSHGFSTGSQAVFKMPISTHELTKGTHKGTFHIPGYQGFLPTNTSNPYCARVASGADLREKKSMLTSQFHVNLLNYCGHTPVHPNNDNGGRKVDDVSTMGRNYQWPKQNAFPAM
jgi:hypothetical protein